MPEVSNVCAGPFGAFYDFYIERPWLAGAIGRVVWGVDLAPLYASMQAIGRLPDGATVLDVPCGGGVALRALRPGQRVRWIAVDIDETMHVPRRGLAPPAAPAPARAEHRRQRRLPAERGPAPLAGARRHRGASDLPRARLRRLRRTTYAGGRRRAGGIGCASPSPARARSTQP